MELPQDSFMLLSVINMKLRDNYSSLDSLCDDMNVDKADITSRLEQIGYSYNEKLNSFK
jgi:hypothetical protein